MEVKFFEYGFENIFTLLSQWTDIQIGYSFTAC